jgi:cell wall assembly regulator SMI1
MIASEAKITHVERHFGVRFPDDYRKFLLTHGGMDEFVQPARTYVVIHAIDELIPINEAGLIQERFPRAVVIGGNGSREMLTYDFRDAEPSLVLLDITAEDWSAALYQAPSLTALLAQLPERGWLFG